MLEGGDQGLAQAERWHQGDFGIPLVVGAECRASNSRSASVAHPAAASCTRFPVQNTLRATLFIPLFSLPQATLEHRSASAAVGVTLSGKRWEVAHDFGKKVRCLVCLFVTRQMSDPDVTPDVRPVSMGWGLQTELRSFAWCDLHPCLLRSLSLPLQLMCPPAHLPSRLISPPAHFPPSSLPLPPCLLCRTRASSGRARWARPT